MTGIMFFYVAKPYKKDRMCHADGWIFTSVGILFLMGTSNNKVIYIDHRNSNLDLNYSGYLPMSNLSASKGMQTFSSNYIIYYIHTHNIIK